MKRILVGLIFYLVCIASSTAQRFPTATSFLEKATALYQHDSLTEANSTIQQAIQLLTTNTKTSDAVKIYSLQGDIFRRLEDCTSALESYKKALALSIAEKAESVTVGNVQFKIGLCKYQTGQVEEARQQYETARSILEERAGRTSYSVANVLENLGYLLSDDAKYAEAVPLLQRAWEIKQDTLGRTALETAKLQLNLGVKLSYNNQHQEALRHVLEAAAIIADREGEDALITGSVYLNVGFVCFHQGDYGRAANYFKKSGQNFKQNLGETHPYVGDALLNLGSCYHSMRQYTTALTYFQQALAIHKQTTPDDYFTLANSYYNRGGCELGLKRYAAAAQNFEQALELYKKAVPPGHPYLVETTIKLAKCACEQKNNAEAESRFQQAKRAYDADSERATADDRAYLFLEWGICQQKNGQLAAALANFDKGLQLLGVDSDTLRFDGSLVSQSFPVLLFHRGETLFQQYQTTQDIATLNAAAGVFAQYARLYDMVRRSYREEVSRQFVMKDVFSGFDVAIQVEQELHRRTQDEAHLLQAFQFAEKGKSVLLLDNINFLTSTSNAGIPDSLVEKQRLIRLEIANWEAQYNQQKATPSEQKIAADGLFKAKEEYNHLLNRLETEFPSYYALRYGSATPLDGAALRKLTDAETALLEFVLSDSSIYVFVIQNAAIQVIQTPLPDNFDLQLQHLRRSLSDQKLVIQQPEEARQLFTEQAYSLYQLLLQPAFQLLSPNVHRLLIVPHGSLEHIPFEILLTEEPEAKLPFSKMPYVLRRYSVQYAYSATFLLEQQRTSRQQHQYRFAGFAPIYEGKTDTTQDENLASFVRSGALALPGAKREVQQIADLLQGTIFLDHEATETNFKQQAGHYQILHLSMHALLNQEQPLYSKLLFSSSKDTLNDGFLTAAELYNMQLQTDLAVLSACNTGYGQVYEGEGVMSLSRAFAYAGVPSAVMSLWKIPDAATAQLMVEFYRHLKAGQTKDEALRQAKLYYLDNLLAPEQAHPYYWAGFVSVGDSRPLHRKHNWSGWLIGLGLLMTGLTFFWWWKKF